MAKKRAPTALVLGGVLAAAGVWRLTASADQGCSRPRHLPWRVPS
jgi:hypothetical protein